jgi:hypothetical protein
LFVLVAAYAVHQVVQVCCGEFPGEWPGGLVVAVHEAQQGGGELAEAGEVVGGDDFLLDDGEENLDLAMNGLIPVVTGVEANTFPVCTSSPASSAREPWRLYSCS